MSYSVCAERINVPIYGTELTIGLIENKLAEHEMTESADLRIIKAGQTIQLGPFSVEFIHTNHSIADSVAMV